MTIHLNELQTDALTEIFNIGMGRAANALSKMADDEIALAVPTIAFSSRKKAAEILAATAGKRVCSVTQRVEGEFNADAILIFPESNSLEIVRLMVGDASSDTLSEMEQEALSEIGNIILNACIGTLTNILGGEFNISLPVSKIDTCEGILDIGRRAHDEVVMLLYIDFVLNTRRIHGHVAVLQDVHSMPNFVQKIQVFLASIDS